ncbi:MAG TPA: hypothetical protein DEB06_03605 [Phycisphaerales bacterium]|nr:hypothetical protein [Phycisphaerales bacterium]
MKAQDDERYAQTLVTLAERDTARLAQPNHGGLDLSTAAWLAEELRRQAETLRITPGTAQRLRASVETLRTAACEARRQESRPARRGPGQNGAASA